MDLKEIRETSFGDEILSPLDDRYADKVNAVKGPEYRLYLQCKIEYEWAKYVATEFNWPGLDQVKPFEFTTDLEDKISQLEKKTKHDVKAIELAVAETFFPKELHRAVHAGLTSEDINSMSIGLWLDGNLQVLFIHIHELVNKLQGLNYRVPYYICACTHGQKAILTSWATRFDTIRRCIARNLRELRDLTPIPVKFGGAINTLSCIQTLLDTELGIGKMKARSFVESSPFFREREYLNEIGLKRDTDAFQVPLYDRHAQVFQTMIRVFNLITKLTMDIWDGYKCGHFKLELPSEQIGSSVMCQKKNPIGLENGCGNLKLAITLCEHMSTQLQNYILERDLRDSTQLRNIPVIFGHVILGIGSITEDISKLQASEYLKSQKEVIENGQIFSAQIMTALRVLDPEIDAYETIRKLTQGKQMSMQEMFLAVAPMFVQKGKIDLLEKIMLMREGDAFESERPKVNINTSNMGKQAEYRKYFEQFGYRVEFTSIDIREPVADHRIIANYKACQFAQSDEIVLVEDTALHIDEADVGVNVKHVLDSLETYIGRRATFEIYLSYYNPCTNRVYLYRGISGGTIVAAKGDNGFGFDSIFLPDGACKTLAEMDPEEKEEYNARKEIVKRYVTKHPACISTRCYFKWEGEFQSE